MEILEVELRDTVRAHILSSDGTYHKLDLRGKEKHDSQEELIEIAKNSVVDRFVEIETGAYEPAISSEQD